METDLKEKIPREIKETDKYESSSESVKLTSDKKEIVEKVESLPNIEDDKYVNYIINKNHPQMNSKKKWKDCTAEEKSKVNLMEIPSNEVLLDCDDTKDLWKEAEKKLEEDKYYGYSVWDTHSTAHPGSKHIKLKFNNLTEHPLELRNEIRRVLIKRYGACESKFSERTLIPIPNRIHYKSGEVYSEVEPSKLNLPLFNTLREEDISEAKDVLELSKKYVLKTLTDEEFKNYFYGDPFFLWIRENIEKLPQHCEFNNVVAKNIGIACKLSGRSREEIDYWMKPLIKRRGRWYSYPEFIGYLRGNFTEYNKVEIEHWREKYISNLKPEKFYEDDFEKLTKNEEIKFSVIKNDWYDTWGKIKGSLVNFMKENEKRILFVTHNKDTIFGKPQLVYDTLQKIPLVLKTERTDKKTKEKIYNFKFLDDNYDGRSDGYSVMDIKEDFWVYRVVCRGEEFFVLSKNQLQDKSYTFHGMKIEMKNISEFTKTFKLRSVSSVFICTSVEKHIKTLPKNELIEFSKRMKDKWKWDEKGFQDFVFTHPNGNIYDFTDASNKIQLIQLLSGKYEGYPLHLLRMGIVGTGKTTALECLDWKFKETRGILEAGNSTPKSLIPSFKEKPASPGYVLECVRISLVDELMKMITNLNNQSRYAELTNQYLSQLNPLLEHKRRTFSSGNDNSITTSATSKVIIATNPLQGISTIAGHVGVIDITTLSRMLIWIQNEEEVKKILKKEVKKNNNIEYYKSINKNIIDIYVYDIISDFLTIYDSCQEFTCKMDEKRVKSIFQSSYNMLSDPMKTVWSARGLHHSMLILDGIVKIRCLFRDFDENFEAKDEDFLVLDDIIKKMTENWQTNLEILGGFCENWTPLRMENVVNSPTPNILYEKKEESREELLKEEKEIREKKIEKLKQRGKEEKPLFPLLNSEKKEDGS